MFETLVGFTGAPRIGHAVVGIVCRHVVQNRPLGKWGSAGTTNYLATVGGRTRPGPRKDHVGR
jgi:hypothetical protein